MDKIISLLILSQNRIIRTRGQLVVAPAKAKSLDIIRKGCPLTICGEDADAVEWAERLITTHPLRSGKDVFSFDFTGCSLARYITPKGETFSAHIHADPCFEYDCKDTWIDYVISNNIIQLRMFRPDCDLLIGTMGMECWGLISREGNCYTIILQEQPDSSYRLERIRQHLVGTTIFDFGPVLKHGMDLTLAQQKVDDYLHRRCNITRNNWNRFWGSIGRRDIYNRATAPPLPASHASGGGPCLLL